MKTCLTIAGSDCSGGAGIQADLKTMLACGVYGMSVITALTAQNTMGVQDIMPVTPSFVKSQLKSVFDDIPPYAIKTGMLFSSDIMEAVSTTISEYNCMNLVVDPVMVSTSGHRLIDESAVDSMKELLFPLAKLITPNLGETSILSGISVESMEDMKKASALIKEKYKVNVLCKGGHLNDCSNDLLCSDEGFTWFEGQHIHNPNTHGTGCTLSAAIASHLASGYSLEKSIEMSKKYISGAISYGLDLGNGRGPLNHGFNIK